LANIPSPGHATELVHVLVYFGGWLYIFRSFLSIVSFEVLRNNRLPSRLFVRRDRDWNSNNEDDDDNYDDDGGGDLGRVRSTDVDNQVSTPIRDTAL
jgi:hypothetical protein